MPKISELPAANNIAASDVFAVVQNGVTKRATIGLLPASGSSSSSSGVFRVDDYGAKGDGSTDDTVAIMSAINALTDGGTLFFTPGKTYLTSDTVYIEGRRNININLHGATITCSANGDSSAIVRVQSSINVTVSGGYLMHKNTGARKNDADGLSFFQCTDALAIGVRVGYVYSIGIRSAGSRRVSIIGCSVNGNIADGIGAYGAFRQGTNDGSMSAGSATLTAPSLKFNEGDVGGVISIDGAGPSGANLTTTIAGYVSSSQVTLATAATTSVTNYYVKLARPSDHVVVSACHLMSNGDDAISSVGYKTYSSVPIGPNRSIVFTGNTVEDGRSRGIIMVGTFQGIMSDNVVHTTKQGGIFVQTEPSVGGSWGCHDVLVDNNTVEDANTDYGNGNSNYGSIMISGTSSTDPCDAIAVTNNIIRGGKSYYISVGGDNGSNGADSITNVNISGNHCYGGNANNPGIQVIKTTNIIVDNNRLDKSRSSSIRIYSTAGLVIVRDNVITNGDTSSSGSATLDIPASALKRDNVVNGAFAN